jgi:processive 1,2-diacylglycerol beta-glucosyltransferase
LPKQRVLLLSEGFGVGHTQAAHALSIGLHQSNQELETKVIELGSVLHPTMAPLLLDIYRKALSINPKLYGLMYRQYNRSLSRLSLLALHRLFYAQTAELIQQFGPDAIVCTHPFPNAVISRLKKFGLSIPLYTVITDYEAHGAWITPECDTYLVSTSEVQQKLIQEGIRPQRVKITGIPVHPNFKIRHDQQQIRSQFQLKQLPTVMVMGGGWGLMDRTQLMDQMMRWRDQIQFIFCLGKNEKARQKMASQALFQHPNIHFLGFTEEIDKLMEVSDLLITKPGGLTCTEACMKGVPMLFYKPIPGQEEGNCQYFTENGFGEEIKSTETIERWFQLLIHENDRVLEKRKIILEMGDRAPIDCTTTLLQLLYEKESKLQTSNA